MSLACIILTVDVGLLLGYCLACSNDKCTICCAVVVDVKIVNSKMARRNELHRYRPQTISATAISATQKTISATSKVDIGHRSISATNV